MSDSDKYQTTSGGTGSAGAGEQFMLNESVHSGQANYNNGGKQQQQQQYHSGGINNGSSHQSSNKSNKSNVHNPINQQLIATSSGQGSYHSLPAGGSGGTPLHDPTLYYLQHQHSLGGGGGNGSNNSPSSTISHQAAAAAASHTAYRHSHPGESIALVSRSGSVRARVNSDSKCHANLANTRKSISSSENNTRNKCATQQQQTSATTNNANNRNNNTKSNNNNNNYSSSNRPSASASESTNNPLRHIIRQNSKNIEFNRQLSAPTENQNSYNSVYNLHHGVLNNSSHYYHSGSPNTNSLNRTKKKRSFKLNGR